MTATNACAGLDPRVMYPLITGIWQQVVTVCTEVASPRIVLTLNLTAPTPSVNSGTPPFVLPEICELRMHL